MLRLRAVLAAIPLLLACSSCVGVRSGLLPELDRDEIMRGERMPAISYEIGAPLALDSWAHSENQQLFCDAFVEARRGPAADDLHIQLSMRSEEDLHLLCMGTRLLCILSLGIIPAFGQAEETLVARVEFKGRLLREYHYEDRITFWAQILLLPWFYTSSNGDHVHQALKANMLLHLIRDLRQDLPQLVPATPT